jgi:hypothetical protein
MRVTIHPGDLDHQGLLAYFATSRLNAISDAFDSIHLIELWLKLEDTESTSNKICELRITRSGHQFFVIKKSRDFEESILLAIDELLNRIGEKSKGV